jgi:hypothetical protein
MAFLNDAIPPAARAAIEARGGGRAPSVTVFGGEDALVNVEPLQAKARSAVGDIIDGVVRVVNKALPAAIAATASLQYRGTQGSFLSYLAANNIVIKYKFFQIGADNSDLIGYPTHAANSLLSNYSGFVLCENAVIAIGGSAIEEQAIEDMLNAGVFIE